MYARTSDSDSQRRSAAFGYFASNDSIARPIASLADAASGCWKTFFTAAITKSWAFFGTVATTLRRK